MAKRDREPSGVDPSRREEFLQAIHALNSQFAEHVKRLLEERPRDLWLPAAQRYTEHCRSLYESYKDVADVDIFDISSRKGQELGPEEEVGGEVYACGAGDAGQLGLGEGVPEAALPRRVKLPGPAERVREVACGGMHTVALTAGGRVYTWGVNDEGALGRAASKYSPGSEALPGEVRLPSSEAASQSGAVYGWGVFRNSSGAWRFAPGLEMAQEPRQIDMEEACALASGHDHCMAVTPGGKLLTWGTAEGGRLGRVPEGRASKVDSGAEEEQLAPREVPDLPPVAKVSAGLFTSFAVSAGGEVFGWGGNNYGQLATREEGPFFFPQRISPLSGSREVACGDHHALALTTGGDVLAVGRATYGRLGRHDVDESSDEPHAEPGRVDAIPGRARSVRAGPTVSGALTEDGGAYVWGDGQNNQLGVGDDSDRTRPFLLTSKEGPFSGLRALGMSFGGQHSAFVACSPGTGAASEEVPDGPPVKRSRPSE